MATDEVQRAKARQRAAAWRAANPERVKALSAKSRERRKAKWAEFLAAERMRYAVRAEMICERQKAIREKDPERSRAIRRRSYRKNPLSAAISCAGRRAAKLQATPSWADKAAIAAIYAEAKRLTATTGVPHEVDHIVPLRGRACSGLHVVHNLRVVTRAANRRKGFKLHEADGTGHRPGIQV